MNSGGIQGIVVCPTKGQIALAKCVRYAESCSFCEGCQHLVGLRKRMSRFYHSRRGMKVADRRTA